MKKSPLIQRINEMFGLNNPAGFFDPNVVSDEEIDEDLISVNWDLQHADDKVDEFDNKHKSLLDDAAEADEWKEDMILDDAAAAEEDKETWQDIYSEKREMKRLIQANMSFRERISMHNGDLNISEALQSADSNEVQAKLKQELQDHLQQQKTIRNFIGAFNKAKKVNTDDRSSRDREKQRKRMEARQKTRDSTSANSDEDFDQDRTGNSN